METLWTKGPSSIRDLQEAFPEKDKPAYTTVQTVVYRLEFKKAVRRTEKISNAHVFDPCGFPQFRPASDDRRVGGAVRR
jgi:BlaI family transcriptional regulator, penicillinase repressor